MSPLIFVSGFRIPDKPKSGVTIISSPMVIRTLFTFLSGIRLMDSALKKGIPNPCFPASSFLAGESVSGNHAAARRDPPRERFPHAKGSAEDFPGLAIR
jgi:hypothetical protein